MLAVARAERRVCGGDRSVRGGADQLAELQHARMLSAMVEVACERGAGTVSVADVVKRSGVSRRTFYERFAGLEDCFAATFEHALARATDSVIAGYEPHAQWRERIRSGLIGLLSFLEAEPRMGRILIVESLAGGPRVAARRGQVLANLTMLVEAGRLERAATSELPRLTSEGLVGAVSSVLQKRLQDPTHAPLLELTNELASMIVLPYLGAAAARRELGRPLPVPAPGQGREPLFSDPFKDAGMRLTYRTVRVLIAVAEHPGASNRLIGQTAEIADQGQISKLLRRLERAGMLANAGAGPETGRPNAWTLTNAGTQVVQSIGATKENHHGENNRHQGERSK
jgi:AcrR family transcriptional regulator